MVYYINSLDKFLKTIDKKRVIKHKENYIYNIPMSFDIETSSFYKMNGIQYDNKQAKKLGITHKAMKYSNMYIWQFAIDNNVIYGRNWSEFKYFIEVLYRFFNLRDNYIVVYVHNLSYEYQFICKMFKWVDVFADSERKPLRAETKSHIIFKCSYRLSGYSLQVLANNLRDKTLSKMVGDLDYDLIRNSKTPITKKELGYCVNDVLIVTQYIKECIEDYEHIANIPLTQTGKIRRKVRSVCFKNEKYNFMIKKLSLDVIEYQMLVNAFMGGFTHCNAMYTENICDDVTSFDFTSSYPTVMIAEKYPMSKGKKIYVDSLQQLKELIANYCLIVDLEFNKIKSSFLWENIISLSKCRNVKNPLINNGRIVSADSLRLTVTDIDFLNIEKFYKWENIKIGVVYIYKRDYLPKEIISCILELYTAKTTLKGVEGKENEYLHSKELLNSIYGMCVTSIIHDTHTFDNEKWVTVESNINEEIEKYNNDKNRFLFYPWGVWVTAYARNNLYTGILECKQDYIYSDTDSIKILNAENHKEYFERYNKWITKKLETAIQYHGFDKNILYPKTIKNEIKPLGIWDFDGFYKRFKTLGAKRYMIEKENGNLSITVCGLAKKSGKEYIASQKQPFLFFNDGMFVDSEHTGKMIHTYIDNPFTENVIDYMGIDFIQSEKSYIHLEKTDYLLSITKMYIDYFTGLQKLNK